MAYRNTYLPGDVDKWLKANPHVNVSNVLRNALLKMMQAQHDVLIRYQDGTDEDGIHLVCIPCGSDRYLGFDVSVEQIVEAQKEHLST